MIASDYFRDCLGDSTDPTLNPSPLARRDFQTVVCCSLSLLAGKDWGIGVISFQTVSQIYRPGQLLKLFVETGEFKDA